MSNENIMIILKDQPRLDIKFYDYDKNTGKYRVKFNGNKIYEYTKKNFEEIKNSKNLEAHIYKFKNKESGKIYNTEKAILFEGKRENYIRIFFYNGGIKDFKEKELLISRNILGDKEIKNNFEYYRIIAENIGLESEDGNNILKNKFDKIEYLDDKSVLRMFLKGRIDKVNSDILPSPIIYPFGSNLSQINAVENALNNKISVIEGPPGTGKTQTILNIIANIILRGKTVAVVSNNNSATDNVYEKMEKYGLDYIVAQLGSSENKKNFIKNKQKPYPNFKEEIRLRKELPLLIREVSDLKKELIIKFEKQNRKSSLTQELYKVNIEKNYFEEEVLFFYKERDILKNRDKLSSNEILELWIKYQKIITSNRFILKLKFWIFYWINDFDRLKIKRKDSREIVSLLKNHFYDIKIKEINKEIEIITRELSEFSIEKKIEELTEKSMKILKLYLSNKYSKEKERTKFEDKVFKNEPEEFLKEYPVVLSTTYSITSSLEETVYDYVIVDEASQVDLTTGALAMHCAENMVIVGDLKQLPNVVGDYEKKIITCISEKHKIESGYRYENHSLLSSVCEVLKEVPKTLLKEHYRCHPKIINYCNQKFYNNELIIMTTDKNEKDVLKVHITSEGNHARGKFNQRQIDEIKQNILPELNSKNVGVITPYVAQTSALGREIENQIDISTVHKFQGREKDDIIISTVDNKITEFTDNPNMLNVAVSRAKNRLRLVVSDNEKNQNTNIGDLVKYIKYNNFEIKKGDVFSIFDILYKSLEKREKEMAKHKKISDYDSENLMYELITKVLSEDRFRKLDVIIHQSLKSIIRNPYKLTEDEVKYGMNDLTHLDFIIYNKIDKSIVLAIEVDGYSYHKKGSKQEKRDRMKDSILKKYNIPLIRFNTTESNEKIRLQEKLMEILS